MNNKGMTLVELLVAFALLMVVVVGMFNLILDTRLDLDNKQIIRDYVEYSNYLNNEIMQDLIDRKPIAFAIKKSEGDSWTCVYNDSYTFTENCKMNDDPDNNKNLFNVKVYLDEEDVKNLDHDQKVSGSLLLYNSDPNKDICNHMYPCLVYAYYDKNEMAVADPKLAINAYFTVIAVNTSKDKNGYGYGIKYGSSDKAMFESVPHQSMLDKRIVLSSVDIERFREKNSKFTNKNIVVNLPIYMAGENKNYGFKVVYPLYPIDRTTNPGS